MHMDSKHIDPSKIMQIGTGFFATKTLLSAVELGLFTSLAKEPASTAGSAARDNCRLGPASQSVRLPSR
jgi:hypothetical protein